MTESPPNPHNAPRPHQDYPVDAYVGMAAGGLVASLQERAAKAEAERDQWRYTATHDSLTGLPNRLGLELHLKELIVQGQPFGIAMIDIDKFKLVNDTFGHDKGDELLRSVGDHFSRNFKRSTDSINHIGDPLGATAEDNPDRQAARLSGDEFIVTFGLAGNDRRGADTSSIHERMDREHEFTLNVINDFIRNPDYVTAEMAQLGVHMSLGVAVWDPNNPVDERTLLKQADESMYEAKPEGSR